MPTFVLRLIAPRPNFAQTLTDSERAIMNSHAAHWRPYLERGDMVVFGPVLTDDDSYGLAVVETDDEHALREFAAQDPVVTTGPRPSSSDGWPRARSRALTGATRRAAAGGRVRRLRAEACWASGRSEAAGCRLMHQRVVVRRDSARRSRASAGRDHRGGSFMDGVNDLGVVDPTQVVGLHPEVGMPSCRWMTTSGMPSRFSCGTNSMTSSLGR